MNSEVSSKAQIIMETLVGFLVEFDLSMTVTTDGDFMFSDGEKVATIKQQDILSYYEKRKGAKK